MTKKPSQVRDMVASINRLIAYLESHAESIQEPLGETPRGARSTLGEKPGDGRNFDELGDFITRLRQIQDWLVRDKRLLGVVDDFIGQQLHEIDRLESARNIRLNVLSAVLGAVLGWLLSALSSPVALWHLIVH